MIALVYIRRPTLQPYIYNNHQVDVFSLHVYDAFIFHSFASFLLDASRSINESMRRVRQLTGSHVAVSPLRSDDSADFLLMGESPHELAA